MHTDAMSLDLVTPSLEWMNSGCDRDPEYGAKMYRADQATVNTGRDKRHILRDKFAQTHDLFLIHVNGVLDLLHGPETGWMITGSQRQVVFDLARSAMKQWEKRGRATQALCKNNNKTACTGTPLVWAVLLCHKVIRDGDAWEKYRAYVRTGDWTMNSVHSRCKKNKFHHFSSIRRDGAKSYHTLRVGRLMKRVQWREAATDLSNLLESAGCDALEDCVLDMLPFEDARRPPHAGLTASCACEMWERWSDRRDSELFNRRLHIEQQRTEQQQLLHASIALQNSKAAPELIEDGQNTNIDMSDESFGQANPPSSTMWAPSSCGAFEICDGYHPAAV